MADMNQAQHAIALAKEALQAVDEACSGDDFEGCISTACHLQVRDAIAALQQPAEASPVNVAQVGEADLPELPFRAQGINGFDYYTKQQMREYALAAIRALAAQREPT